MPDNAEDLAPQGFTVSCGVRFQPGPRGRKQLRKADCGLMKHPLFNPKSAIRNPQSASPCRIPRLARLMALAIHFDGLIKSGLVRDYADIARLGGISRARVTQIMNLLLLAPEIQEAILFLSPVARGKDAVTEHHVREVLRVLDWEEQKRRWIELGIAPGIEDTVPMSMEGG